MKRDISNLRMWKDILVGCYGLFCIWLLFDSYSQTLASNTEMLNSLYFPHYLAFILLLLHAITTSAIFRILNKNVRFFLK